MRCQEVLSRAYLLTIRNPLLWLFGLVMLGGYNLFLINFFSLVSGDQWEEWPLSLPSLFHSSPIGIFGILAAVIATFIILNLLKIIFIVVVHGLVHQPSSLTDGMPPECGLCERIRQQQMNPINLPYLNWLGRVMAASGVTIFLSLGSSLMIDMVLRSQSYDKPVAVIINLLVVAAITCLIGTWNVFTSYFIVLHGMNFGSASSAAIDLLVKHAARVLEFIVLLSVIYSFSVAVGNAFIHLWRTGYLTEFFLGVRALYLAVLVLWFAVNNAFFNVAMFLFFNRVVKATPATKEFPLPVHQ
jgi:hypothetical protein